MFKLEQEEYSLDGIDWTNVECAKRGKPAIAMVQLPHKFDACFMDVQMPEMYDYVSKTFEEEELYRTVAQLYESNPSSKS